MDDHSYRSKGNHEIKWTMEAKKSFKDKKKSISEVLVLVSPDFDKVFLIFSYASEHTVAVVLLQKIDQGE